MAHEFLSDEWFEAVEAIRQEHGDPPPNPTVQDLVVNITVEGAPSGPRDIRIDGGQFEIGHADGAPTKLTVPYEVAKAIFIEGNPQAGMQAFMSGQIRVEGDMTTVMALQTAQPSPEADALRAKIADITA